MSLSEVVLTIPVATKRRYNFLGSASRNRAVAYRAIGSSRWPERHRRVQVHVEPDLARQAVEMKKVHADPQSVFHAVAPGITDDQIPGGFLKVIREEQRRFLAA